MTTLIRASDPELMDDPDQEPTQLARGLADLRGVNSWLGGTRVVLKLLEPLVRGRELAFSVLDVATGSADVPLAVARWARRRGLDPEIVATDIHSATLAVAQERVSRESDISVIPADARVLPFADSSFDVALCCTALHHFAYDEAIAVLRELRRVVRKGVIVSDLRRSLTGLAGARLLAGTVWRAHPVTRHDGPLSVRRAFTPAELAVLANAAGWPNARVRTHPFFRVSLVLNVEQAP